MNRTCCGWCTVVVLVPTYPSSKHSRSNTFTFLPPTLHIPMEPFDIYIHDFFRRNRIQWREPKSSATSFSKECHARSCSLPTGNHGRDQWRHKTAMFGHDLLLEHNLLSSLLGKFSIVIEKHEIKSSGIWLRSFYIAGHMMMSGFHKVMPVVEGSKTGVLLSFSTGCWAIWTLFLLF